jgi:hypothetical protein
MNEPTTTTTAPEVDRDMFGARRGEYEIPDYAKVVLCVSCSAAIIFVKTPNDRSIPISLATVEMREGKKYGLTHFADCPDAAEWSGARGRRRRR